MPYTFQAEPFFTIEEHLRELCEKCREAMEESKEFIAEAGKRVKNQKNSWASVDVSESTRILKVG